MTFSGFFSLLPAPTQQVWDRDDERKAQRVGSALVVSQTSVPPYGQRKGWVPRREEDYGGQSQTHYITFRVQCTRHILTQHLICVTICMYVCIMSQCRELLAKDISFQCIDLVQCGRLVYLLYCSFSCFLTMFFFENLIRLVPNNAQWLIC